MEHKITYFSDINNVLRPMHRDLSLAFDRIRAGASRDLVKAIRTKTSKKEQDEIKKNLPSICFSGEFSKRYDDSLVTHSGLICLDFDKYETKEQMQEDKKSLCGDRYVMSVFISPSGKGLKVIVKIPKEPQNHKGYFYALKRHFHNPHWDDTSSNISRVCYESFDPFIFVNLESEVWLDMDEPDYREVNRQIDRPTLAIRDESKTVKILESWWARKYPMMDGARNNNAFIFAMACNEYGVPKEVTVSVLYEYMEADFDGKEILLIIKSAYNNHQDKWDTKYFEDVEKISQLKERVMRGEARKQIIQSEDEDPILMEKIIDSIEAELSDKKFWAKSGKGSIKILPINFKKFLEDAGFFKFYPHGSDNFVFVQVTNNLIDNTTTYEIKDFILDYLMEREDSSVYDYFATNTKFFKEDFLSMLSPVDVLFIDDTPDQSYLYFRNCAVMVTKQGVTAIDYIDLGGYVWKNQVVDRDYVGCELTNCDFQKFISNISNKDPERISSVESTIGFLMYGYKDPAYCPATILNDEIISDSPEGGTGKGLFMKAISQLKKVVILNGKKFSLRQGFPYQLVSADAQIIVFDDVNKGFDFEELFSDITEGVTLEKKNKDAIHIPFENSPKIAITTNYAIKGKGNSFERRKWDLEFHNFYTLDFTPRHEFGKTMFSDWDSDEWCQFDTYMISCLRKFMEVGLQKSDFINLKVRQLSAETRHEFIEWCCLVNDNRSTEMFDKFAHGTQVYKNDLYEDFTKEYPDFAPRSKYAISKVEFNRWLLSYANFMKSHEAKQGRDQRGRWIQIIKVKQYSATGKLEF
jgi:hypothetical protein